MTSRRVDPVARFGVVGNPVEHSLSPQIHAAFARRAGIVIDYRRVLAPRDAFVATVREFFAGGGRGLNVTLPFKLDAAAACARVSDRARRAGAVNWLAEDGGAFVGDNTDGVGLVRDLERLRGRSALAGARVLLVGAGGAARGVVAPLLACGPARLVVANRDRSRADGLLASHADLVAVGTDVDAADFATLGDDAFDLVVNATSSSLADASLPLPATVFAEGSLAYDMMYGDRPTRFMRDAAAAGAAATADGLGMLIEQAAESFRLWHGVAPETAPVLSALREGR